MELLEEELEEAPRSPEEFTQRETEPQSTNPTPLLPAIIDEPPAIPIFEPAPVFLTEAVAVQTEEEEPMKLEDSTESSGEWRQRPIAVAKPQTTHAKPTDIVLRPRPEIPSFEERQLLRRHLLRDRKRIARILSASDSSDNDI